MGGGATVRLPEDRKVDMDDGEQYSDQEGGIEIVDMADMETLDIMAPRGLPKEKEAVERKKKTKKKIVKKSESSDEEDFVKPEPDDDATPSSVHNSPAAGAQKKLRPKIKPKTQRHLAPDGEVSSEEDVALDLNQAVDVDESEDEEISPDIRGDFIGWDGKEVPPNQLYFFQFPRQFPTFLPIPDVEDDDDDGMDVDGAASSSSSKKNVSFASDTKPGSSSSAKEPSVKKEDSKAGILSKKPPPPPEGQIGTLLVMKSGKVKMRLGKDIYLDVSAGSQLDFLQHFVHIDSTRTKRATPIAKATRRFIVTPDVDNLLDLLLTGDELPAKEEPAKEEHEGLQAMMDVDEDDD
ncbi:RNA polymerase III RPC4-domain-containing protein [Mrakia frigida]|uniref:DNA-directed RNA polymerase III subunit C53 n=1 Tax=Mrakia frigida TaxID=29902 RepID=UPI003FCC0AE8